jgi:AAA15 family ATPase/GTPase
MFIEFTVSNFRSFKDPTTLSMVAAKIKARDQNINENNTIVINENLTLLTSSAIYGANASGKSNLIKAMSFMKKLVLTSSKESLVNEPIRVNPFRLSTATESKPSLFQIIFLLDNTKYRYGFEANSKEIVSEWLFAASPLKESRLFTRDELGIHVSRNFKEGRGLENKTRANALFLSVSAQWNGEISKKILGWFNNLKVISGLNDSSFKNFTIQQFEQGNLREGIINLVKSLDLAITDITSKKIEDDKVKMYFPENIPPAIFQAAIKDLESEKVLLQTEHKKFNEAGLPISNEYFNLRTEESDGTEKLFYMSGPILDVLANGSILFIDEMEARLHPLITQKLICLFNSIDTNPKRAQIIFTTHDTNLLSNKIFRRDQIWFIEKDRFGCSHLYSLSELKVRNDASFEKDYIEGRYGAIPFLGNIQTISIDK